MRNCKNYMQCYNPTNKEENFMIWKIWGTNLKVIKIEADSFDEAIAKARKINPNYDTAQPE